MHVLYAHAVLTTLHPLSLPSPKSEGKKMNVSFASILPETGGSFDRGDKTRAASITNRLRSASDLCDDGAITTEEKGVLKARVGRALWCVVCGLASFNEMWGDTRAEVVAFALQLPPSLFRGWGGEGRGRS